MVRFKEHYMPLSIFIMHAKTIRQLNNAWYQNKTLLSKHLTKTKVRLLIYKTNRFLSKGVVMSHGASRPSAVTFKYDDKFKVTKYV